MTEHRGEPEVELAFDQIVERLERIVKELERGELPLERSLGRFEEGVVLARKAMLDLDAMEHRIEVLGTDGSLRELDDDDPEVGS